MTYAALAAWPSPAPRHSPPQSGYGNAALSYPKRFAGYDAPEAVLHDAALTAEQKMSALLGWRGAVNACQGGDSSSQHRLLAAIDRALAALRRG